MSGSTFPSDPQGVYQRWAQFTARYTANSATIQDAEAAPYRADELGAPVPEPRQVSAIGMNYRAHAAEAGLGTPESDPVVFAKVPSSVTGLAATVAVRRRPAAAGRPDLHRHALGDWLGP